MLCSVKQDFCVNKGATFIKRFMWDDGTLVSKAITGITQAAPAVVTAASHGLVNGWRAAVVSAGGMSNINSANFPPKTPDLKVVTVVDANNVQFDNVNSSDYTAYTSGGFLVYRQAVSLSGVTATMNIRVSPQTGTVLKALTSSPAAGITIDDSAKTITVQFDTSAETWSYGFFDLEVTQVSGVIVEIAHGTIQID